MQIDQSVVSDGKSLYEVLGWDKHVFETMTRRQRGCLAPSRTAVQRLDWRNGWRDGGTDLTPRQRRAIADLAYWGHPIPQWHAVRARAALASAWLDRWIRLEVLPVGRSLLPVSQLAVEWPETVLSGPTTSTGGWNRLQAGQRRRPTPSTGVPTRETPTGWTRPSGRTPAR